MPPHVNLERLIGTAVVDVEFRRALLDSPTEAATAFELSSEELAVLEAAHATTLEELASHIYAWIARMPRPRRPVPRLWAFDDFQPARAAV